MLCPKCSEEIDTVIVVSECSQEAELDGDKIIEYGIPEVDKTLRCECPECHGEIQNVE
jgi:hypothetical protein